MQIPSSQEVRARALAAARTLAAPPPAQEPPHITALVAEARKQALAALDAAFVRNIYALLARAFNTDRRLTRTPVVSAMVDVDLSGLAQPPKTTAELVALRQMCEALSARLSNDEHTVTVDWSFTSAHELPNLTLTITATSKHTVLQQLAALQGGGRPADAPGPVGIALCQGLADGFNKSLTSAFTALSAQLATARDPGHVLATRRGILEVNAGAVATASSARDVLEIANAIATAATEFEGQGYPRPAVELSQQGTGTLAVGLRVYAPLPRSTDEA